MAAVASRAGLIFILVAGCSGPKPWTEPGAAGGGAAGGNVVSGAGGGDGGTGAGLGGGGGGGGLGSGGGGGGGEGGGAPRDDAGPPDAGPEPIDAGGTDAGRPDSGTPIDAGTPDAGTPDAGPPDAGPPEPPDAGPPDLVSLRTDAGAIVEWRNFESSRCDVQRGCAQAGDRALLRFNFRIANLGGGTVDLRGNDAGLLVEACGGMPRTTLRQFAQWELLTNGSDVVAAGNSDVHCLADDEAVGGSAGSALYTCSAQGLSPSFGSRQPRDGVCSWPDVSGLDAGTYSLRVRVNPNRVIGEARYDNNSVTMPVTLPDTRCRGTWCGAMCCPPNTPCNAAGGCGLPDLTVDRNLMISSSRLALENLGQFSCAVQENCVDAPGNRFLLRFSVRTPNIGDGDFYIGDPALNPRTTWSPCHMHYHYEDFAHYRLLTPDGGQVVAGHKQAFCAFDNDPVYADAGAAKYTCMNQGISVGWADTYADWLECQWVDVTSVPGGNYILEVEVNPGGVIAEKDYSNNVARIPVVIPP